MKNITDMKTLKESLFNKKNLENGKVNKYGITEKDIIGDIKGYPIGIVIRMMEEQEEQGNKPDVKVFQEDIGFGKKAGAFDWDETEAGFNFWSDVLLEEDFDLFFKEYPEYEQYN